MSDDRKSGPRTTGEIMRELQIPNLSAEAWAEHDKRVLEQREVDVRKERLEWRARVEQELSDRGLARALVAMFLDGHVSPTAAVQAAMRMAEGELMAFAGGVGCGKTVAAHVWLLRPLARIGRLIPARVAFKTAAEIARMSRYDKSLEALEDPDKLVIDEVGVEYADEKGSALSDLATLLEARIRAGRGTLITTNLPRAAFAARYRERIADRMRDGHWFDVNGPSLRGGGGAR